jgi:dTDP-4-amino-4,6-dideoxygalactose transaminase
MTDEKKMVNMVKTQIGDEEINAVVEVLRSGMLAQGPKVAEFEKAFAEYIGVKHAIAVSSGTTALHLALLACGVHEGNEVITTPFSFIASANCALYAGARPVFADIDPRTYNISVAEIARTLNAAVQHRVKAIVPVHLYGLPANIDEILWLAARNGLAVIEDAAQAHGAAIGDRKAGSFGDAGCFSLYATKNMMTGEGGMITTNRDDVDERARILRQHGMRVRYHHEMLGYNFRMTDIAGAIGLVQLSRLEEFNRRRIENAAYLSERLTLFGHGGRYGVPYVPEGYRHVFHQYTIRLPEGMDREALRARLKEAGFASEVYYPIPIHLQIAFAGEWKEGQFPVAEETAKQVLSLPIHPAVEKEDLDRMAELLLGF